MLYSVLKRTELFFLLIVSSQENIMTIPESDMITTTEGAGLTGYSGQYIRVLARMKVLPAKKIGRDWVVSKKALLSHKAKMDALGTDKHNPWKE